MIVNCFDLIAKVGVEYKVACGMITAGMCAVIKITNVQTDTDANVYVASTHHSINIVLVPCASSRTAEQRSSTDQVQNHYLLLSVQRTQTYTYTHTHTHTHTHKHDVISK